MSVQGLTEFPDRFKRFLGQPAKERYGRARDKRDMAGFPHRRGYAISPYTAAISPTSGVASLQAVPFSFRRTRWLCYAPHEQRTFQDEPSSMLSLLPFCRG